MTDNNIFHMNRLFIALLCLTIGTSMHAQMKPPQQTDTLSITAVKYNFTDIRPENWPCNLIYKSTIYFQFGEEVFDIVDVSQSIFDIIYKVTDKEQSGTYKLLYNETDDVFTIRFSGYTFTCTKFSNQNTELQPEDYAFQEVDIKPTFHGGDFNQFSKWVSQRLRYPQNLYAGELEGTVTLQFTIDTDGSVINVKVLRSAYPELDKEAVRVVSSSPKWTPGMKNGETVRVTYTFPVIFQM